MILRDRPFLRDGNAAVDHGEAFSFRLSGWRVSVARLALTLFVRHLYHPPTDGSARSAMGRSWFVVPFAPLALVTPLAWVVVFTAVASGYHIQWLDADGTIWVEGTPTPEHDRRDSDALAPDGFLVIGGPSFSDDGHEAIWRGKPIAFAVEGWRVRFIRAALPLFRNHLFSSKSSSGWRGRWGVLRFALYALWTPVVWGVIIDAVRGGYEVSSLDRKTKVTILLQRFSRGTGVETHTCSGGADGQ